MSMMVPDMVHYFVVRHYRKTCEDVVVDVDATRVTHRGNDTLSTLEHPPATQRCVFFQNYFVTLQTLVHRNSV